jgi:hypothetical protein
MQPRDPIDTKATDVSIWVKEKGFINLSDFTTIVVILRVGFTGY